MTDLEKSFIKGFLLIGIIERLVNNMDIETLCDNFHPNVTAIVDGCRA